MRLKSIFIFVLILSLNINILTAQRFKIKKDYIQTKTENTIFSYKTFIKTYDEKQETKWAQKYGYPRKVGRFVS